MASIGSRGLELLGVVSLVVAAVAAGCGSGSKSSGGVTPGGDAGTPGSDSGSFGGDGGLIGSGSIQSMTIAPPGATITSTNGAAATQPFTLSVKYTNGMTATVSASVIWTTDSPVVGAIDSTGLYTANGSLGGVVQVSASFMGQKATAPLTVKLLLQQNPGNVPPGLQSGLQGATAPDASVVWAYPYDGTVWARGLLPPTLQWNGGAATDDYYVHIVSPTFELQQFTAATGAPASKVLLDAATWAKFTDSTSGATSGAASPAGTAREGHAPRPPHAGTGRPRLRSAAPSTTGRTTSGASSASSPARRSPTTSPTSRRSAIPRSTSRTAA